MEAFQVFLRRFASRQESRAETKAHITAEIAANCETKIANLNEEIEERQRQLRAAQVQDDQETKSIVEKIKVEHEARKAQRQNDEIKQRELENETRARIVEENDATVEREIERLRIEWAAEDAEENMMIMTRVRGELSVPSSSNCISALPNALAGTPRDIPGSYSTSTLPTSPIPNPQNGAVRHSTPPSASASRNILPQSSPPTSSLSPSSTGQTYAKKPDTEVERSNPLTSALSTIPKQQTPLGFSVASSHPLPQRAPVDSEDNDSDDEPLCKTRRQIAALPVLDESSCKLEQIQRTMNISEIDGDDFILESPERSGNYYAFRCPSCPERRFKHGTKSVSLHFNNRWTMHEKKLSTSGLMIECGIKLNGISTEWVQLHNSAIAESLGRQKLDKKLNVQERGEKELAKVPAEGNGAQTRTFRSNSHGFYTSPSCLKGVPYEKISESSPYWEPSWNTWKVYLKVEDPSQLIFRRKMKDFFVDFSVHPNQLLSKDYITSTGLLAGRIPEILWKTFTTLTKARTLGAITDEPVDWLRRRLAKVIKIYEKEDGTCSIKEILKMINTDGEFLKVRKIVAERSLEVLDLRNKRDRLETLDEIDVELPITKVRRISEELGNLSLKIDGKGELGLPTDLTDTQNQTVHLTKEVVGSKATRLQKTSFVAINIPRDIELEKRRDSSIPLHQSPEGFSGIGDSGLSNDVRPSSSSNISRQPMKTYRSFTTPHFEIEEGFVVEDPSKLHLSHVNRLQRSSSAIEPDKHGLSRVSSNSPLSKNFVKPKIVTYSRVFELTRLKCGPREFSKGKRSYKQNEESTHLEPFFGGNSIAILEPSLLINRSIITSLGYTTRDTQGDTVQVGMKRPGEEVVTIDCTFASADDADRFADEVWSNQCYFSAKDRIRLRDYHQKYGAQNSIAAVHVEPDQTYIGREPAAQESDLARMSETFRAVSKKIYRPSNGDVASDGHALQDHCARPPLPESDYIDHKAFNLFCYKRHGMWKDIEPIGLLQTQRNEWLKLKMEERMYFSRKAHFNLANRMDGN